MSLTWIEISKSALLHNIAYFRSRSKGKKIIAMVKSNAYGHGLLKVASLIKDEVDAFAVADFQESMKLRSLLKQKPVFILLPVIEEQEVKEVAKSKVSLFVGNLQYLKFLSKINTNNKIKIHLEINSGINRTGIRPDELTKAMEIIEKSQTIELEGIFSHFATLPANLNVAKKQIQTFRDVLKQVKDKNIWIHMENSAAASMNLLPEANAIRPGISLYGLPPSPDYKLDIKPVLSLKSRIIDIHFLDIGEGISYDHTFITRRPSIIATLGIGYGDGYMRNLSNRAWVIIKGKKVPIVGRICMNHILIDITDVPDVKLYETVTLIGKEGEEEITATELAIKSGTINYEITTKLLPHIERIVVE